MFDVLKMAVQRIVEMVLPTIDYLALYRCKVVQQNSDLTLDLMPESPKIPSLRSVPIMYGLPDTTIQVQAGAFVLLGFKDGAPSRPYAALWEPGASLIKLVIAGGANGVARQNDTVDIGTFAMVGVNFQWTPPGGGAPVTLWTFIPGSSGASFTPGAPNGNGKINAASAKIFAG